VPILPAAVHGTGQVWPPGTGTPMRDSRVIPALRPSRDRTGFTAPRRGSCRLWRCAWPEPALRPFLPPQDPAGFCRAVR
jgi:hypothetical protein